MTEAIKTKIDRNVSFYGSKWSGVTVAVFVS